MFERQTRRDKLALTAEHGRTTEIVWFKGSARWFPVAKPRQNGPCDGIDSRAVVKTRIVTGVESGNGTKSKRQER